MITKKSKILIIEDDPLWSLFVESIFEGEKEFELIGIANTLTQAEEIIENDAPDLLLCDIRINDSLVFKLFEQDKYFDLPKIFMTNQLDYHTYDTVQLISKSTFIAKPFHKFTLLASLNLLLKKYPIATGTIEEGYIEVRNIYSQIVKLKFEEVAYIQADGNYSIINTLNHKKFVRKKSLSQILTGLDERFIQVQKAYVVNKDFIEKIDLNTKNILINDSNIPIGRKYREVINTILIEKDKF
jgi:two-component system, LytTR family, response regulator LytT